MDLHKNYNNWFDRIDQDFLAVVLCAGSKTWKVVKGQMEYINKCFQIADT